MSTLARTILLVAMLVFAISTLTVINFNTKASRLLQTQYSSTYDSPIFDETLFEITKQNLMSIKFIGSVSFLLAVGLGVLGLLLSGDKKHLPHDTKRDLHYLLKEPGMKATLPVDRSQPILERVLINKLLGRYREKIGDLEEVKNNLAGSLENLMVEVETEPALSEENQKLVYRMTQNCQFASNSVNISIDLISKVQFKVNELQNYLSSEQGENSDLNDNNTSDSIVISKDDLLTAGFEELQSTLNKLRTLNNSISETLAAQSRLTYELQSGVNTQLDSPSAANKLNSKILTKLQNLHASLSGMNY